MGKTAKDIEVVSEESSPLETLYKLSKPDLIRNIGSWNKTKRDLDIQMDSILLRESELRALKKSISKAYEKLYATPPENGIDTAKTLLDDLETDIPFGTVSVSLDLDNGINAAGHVMAAAQRKMDTPDFNIWLKEFVSSLTAFLPD